MSESAPNPSTPPTNADSNDAVSKDVDHEDVDHEDATRDPEIASVASASTRAVHGQHDAESRTEAPGNFGLSSLARLSNWAWLGIGALVIAAAFLSGLWSIPSTGPTSASRAGEPQVEIIATTPADTATNPATGAVLLPTATPTPDARTDATATPDAGLALRQPITQAVALSIPNAQIPLPTLTPTPEPPPIEPRAVQVAGQANLRMMIASSDFESEGRPIQIPIETRAYDLDAETQIVADTRCIQMGVVNLELALELRLNPAANAVNAVGSAQLYNDFCTNRGGMLDSAEINLTIPADARLQSTHNLFGERRLLNLSGLLDMDAGVILELHVANLRPGAGLPTAPATLEATAEATAETTAEAPAAPEFNLLQPTPTPE